MGGLLLRMISGSRRFYMMPPARAQLSGWLWPKGPLLSCFSFSFHRRPFFVCCCELGLMTAFRTGARYLITNGQRSHSLTAPGWPITPDYPAGRHAMKPFASYWGSTLLHSTIRGNLALPLGSSRPKEHQEHAKALELDRVIPHIPEHRRGPDARDLRYREPQRR